jgi:uncharacterized protein
MPISNRECLYLIGFSGSQYEVWKHTDIVIDVIPGRGGMFSLDNGREKRFLVRSEMCEIPAPAKGSAEAL